MASNGTEKQELIIEAAADSVEESSQDECSDVNLSLDEASDTENYEPTAAQQDVSSDEISSGEDEGEFEVENKKDGACKLKYKQYREQVRKSSTEESSNDDEAAGSDENEGREEDLMNTDLSAYNSGEDDDFNPVQAADSMSDIEIDGDETQESEPEIEEQGDGFVHKKTGETLKCIKMIHELKIPTEDVVESAPVSSPGAAVSAETGDMECT